MRGREEKKENREKHSLIIYYIPGIVNYHFSNSQQFSEASTDDDTGLKTRKLKTHRGK